ncbi:MAG: peptidylprolyl isomerase [Spirochaetaceae bacterium]
MKKIILLILLVITISITSGINFGDPIIANVKLTDTHLIKLKYTEERIKAAEQQVGHEFSSEEKDFILDSIINNVLIKQAAKRDGVVITEDMILKQLRMQVGPNVSDQKIKDTVATQNKKSWKVVSLALIEQLTLQEYIKKAGAEDFKKFAPLATEKEILTFYNNNKTKFVNSDMVRLNHIFFSTQGKNQTEVNLAKKKAEESMLLIKQGKKTFEELVQSESDDRTSALNGGDLGYVAMDEKRTVQLLGNDFISKVFSLDMNSYHGVLESKSGFHIVTITEKRSARFLKINDNINPTSNGTVRQYIQQNIQQQRVNAALPKVTEIIVNKLRSEARIQIIDKSIPWK